jgi:hypothetical protein
MAEQQLSHVLASHARVAGIVRAALTGDSAHPIKEDERYRDFSPTIACEPDFSNSYSFQVRGTCTAATRQKRRLSMVIHRVHDNSDDDCNGYTNVEDGIFEWNLRW